MTTKTTAENEPGAAKTSEALRIWRESIARLRDIVASVRAGGPHDEDDIIACVLQLVLPNSDTIEAALHRDASAAEREAALRESWHAEIRASTAIANTLTADLVAARAESAALARMLEDARAEGRAEPFDVTCPCCAESFALDRERSTRVAIDVRRIALAEGHAAGVAEEREACSILAHTWAADARECGFTEQALAAESVETNIRARSGGGGT